MNKEFYVQAIINHTHSFRLSGDCRTTVCNWCDTRTKTDFDPEATDQALCNHTPECPYWLADQEVK